MQWNALDICGTFRISWLMGKLCTSADSANISQNLSHHMEHTLNIIPPAKDTGRLHQFGKKVLLGIFVGYALFAGEKLEKRHTRSRRRRITITSRHRSVCETNQREGSYHRERRRRCSHIQSTSARTRTVEENSSDHPGEEDDESVLEEQQDAMEAKKEFWSVSGNFICRHHVQERQKVVCLKTAHFQLHLKYIH